MKLQLDNMIEKEQNTYNLSKINARLINYYLHSFVHTVSLIPYRCRSNRGKNFSDSFPAFPAVSCDRNAHPSLCCEPGVHGSSVPTYVGLKRRLLAPNRPRSRRCASVYAARISGPLAFPNRWPSPSGSWASCSRARAGIDDLLPPT